MCFSAGASFTTGALLAATGTASLKKAPPHLRWYAWIPFLFAIQQAIEGLQWLLIAQGKSSLLLGYGFLFFAFLLWPTYLPWSVLKMEPDVRRQHALRLLLGLGLAVTLCLLLLLMVFPLSIVLVGHSIRYEIAVPLDWMFALIYIFVTCGSALLSSFPLVRWFGLAGLVSALAAAIIYTQAFTSVWCFFAAALSLLVVAHVFVSTRPQAAKAFSPKQLTRLLVSKIRPE